MVVWNISAGIGFQTLFMEVNFPDFLLLTGDWTWRLLAPCELLSRITELIHNQARPPPPDSRLNICQSGQYSVSGQLERHWVTVSCCRQRECWYHRTSFQQKNIFLEKLYKTAVCARLVRDDVRYRDCTVDMSDKAQTESIAQVVRTKEHGLLTSLTAALIIQILILALVGVNVWEISNLK